MAQRLAFVLDVGPERFAQFARAHDWQEADNSPDPDRDIDTDRPEQRWRAPEGGEVRYVNDTVLPSQYVDLSAGQTGPLEAAIRDEFTCYDKHEAVEVLDLEQREVTVCHALRLIACTAPGPFDKQVFDAVVGALRDERAEVRITALESPHYTKWTEFLPEVIRLAEEDQDEDVAGVAGTMQMLLEARQQINEAG